MEYLEIDLFSHNRSIISTILKPVEYFSEHIHTWFPMSLKWCSECVKKGFHSWLHQFSLIKRCPTHQIDLICACPGCMKQIPFLLSDYSLSDPFTCKCGYMLADLTLTQWSEWNILAKVEDGDVLKWLAGESGVVTETDRLLFIPWSVSVDMFNFEPTITSKFPDIEHIKKMT